MILYHGSNIAVEHPQLLLPERKLDFGFGFYLTSSLEQAERWARLTAERRQTGNPVVTAYTIADKDLQNLQIKTFEKADARWLRYVAANRKGTAKTENADIVTGPVANDQTMPTISRFLIGELTLAETIRRLRPQNLKNQYAFKTELALTKLILKEVIRL